MNNEVIYISKNLKFIKIYRIKNVIQYFDAFLFQTIFFVLEYANDGNLLNYIGKIQIESEILKI
jgi:hypothetical protein